MNRMTKDSHIYGIVTVGERGQIVIPKEARNRFNIKPKEKLLILGPPRLHGEKGVLVLMKAEDMREFALSVLGAFKEHNDETTSKNP